MSEKTIVPLYYKKLSLWQRKELRSAYAEAQNGLCAYCGEPLDEPAPERITDRPINWSLFPENFLRHPVHLQHNHETGLTEGAVHAYCNAVMWQYDGR